MFGGAKSKTHEKPFNGHQMKALEGGAETEARASSRILTTAEARTHRMQMQQRLDELYNEEDENDDEVSLATESHYGLQCTKCCID